MNVSSNNMFPPFFTRKNKHIMYVIKVVCNLCTVSLSIIIINYVALCYTGKQLINISVHVSNKFNLNRGEPYNYFILFSMTILIFELQSLV